MFSHVIKINYTFTEIKSSSQLGGVETVWVCLRFESSLTSGDQHVQFFTWTCSADNAYSEPMNPCSKAGAMECCLMFAQMWPNLIFNDCACVCQCEGSRLGKKKKSRCCSVKFWNWTTVSLGALYYSEDHKHLVIQTIVGQCLSALLAILAEK